MIVIIIEIYVFVGRILRQGSERSLENVINRLRSIRLKRYILCLRLGLMLSLVRIESKAMSAWQNRHWPHTIGVHSLQLAGEGQAVCGIEPPWAVITLQLSGSRLITREDVQKAHRCRKNYGIVTWALS